MRSHGFPLPPASARNAILIGLLLATASVTAAPAADNSKWHLRFFVSHVEPDVAADDIDSDTRIDDDSDTGFGISLEHRFSRLIGLELGALFTVPDLGVRQTQPGNVLIVASDGLRLTPIYAALNLHFAPGHKVDVYAGPLLAYVLYDDLTLAPGNGVVADLDAEDDLAIGASLGLDVGLGRGRWTFGASVRYLDTTFESTLVDGDPDDDVDVDIDPLILSFGFGYRF